MSYQLEYYHRNREKINARRREEWKKNPRVREISYRRHKRYRLRRDKGVAAAKRRHKYANDVQYRNKEKARLAIYSRVRNHNKRTTGKITKGTFGTLIDRDGNKCLGCLKSPPEVRLSIDHILPISRGGTNDISNLQILCVPCNSAKGAR